ncbi:helix-turn-helix domain-containing protein [Streptomyces sp. NPDC127079]|uniref:helix-turn-helix domain-containing protein n=1 Tax=Streptomyces sp. NPDC127079 TaxID=3347132 RepID=UPI0036493694
MVTRVHGPLTSTYTRLNMYIEQRLPLGYPGVRTVTEALRRQNVAQATDWPTPDAGPLEHFAHDLRQLREQAGTPDYRSMARRVGCAPSRLSTAAAGKRLPTLETTLLFVRACGRDQTEQAGWSRRWKSVRAELERASPPPSSPSPAPAPTPQPAEPVMPKRRRRRHVLAGGAFLVVVCTAIAGAVLRPHPQTASRLSLPASHVPSQVPAPEPERRHGPLVMVPGRVVDLDSLAPSWAEQTSPGTATDDVEFTYKEHELVGVRNADVAVLLPGSVGTFQDCALEQDYGVALSAAAIKPGTMLCDITSDNRVALLRIVDVQRDASGLPDQVTFDAVVWVPPHKT